MHHKERQDVILNLISRTGSVSINELVDHLNVSDMTVRRDLDELENRGLLWRVHGGAIDSRGRSYEPPLQSRNTVNRDLKERIGKAAADLVINGDSLALDIGSTTYEIARNLVDKRNLTIITPSLDIAMLLADHTGLRVILTGGIIRPGEHSLIGSLAESAFGNFRVDKLFLGIAGVDFTSGLTEFNLEDSLVKKAMLECAKRTILLADSTKFDKVTFVRVAPLENVDCIITDREIDQEVLKQLKERNIEVILC